SITRGFPSPEDIVAALTQDGHTVGWHVLVGAESHRRGSCSSGHCEESLITQAVLGIGHTGAHLFAREAWIVAEHVGLRPTLSDQFQNELDREPRSLDDGFADKDRRVGGDVFLPVHVVSLTTQCTGFTDILFLLHPCHPYHPWFISPRPPLHPSSRREEALTENPQSQIGNHKQN